MVVNHKLTSISGTGSVRRLEIQLQIAAPVSKVWESITDVEHVAHWWTSGTIGAHEGGRIILEDGTAVNGTVKICLPPYCFAFTWNDKPEEAAHPHLIDAVSKSLVTFQLVEEIVGGKENTQLTFSQYLPPGEILGAAAGWHQIVGERLKSYVETGLVSDDADQRFMELQKIYADTDSE